MELEKNHEKFYEKCTLDAAYFFDIYFRFMTKVNSEEFVKSNAPVKTKEGVEIDPDYVDIFYFFWLLFQVTSDIGNEFIERKVNPWMFYDVPNNALLEKDLCICDVDKIKDNDISKRDATYFYKWRLQDCVDQIQEKITIERVLYNIITKVLDVDDKYHLKEAFKINDEFVTMLLLSAKRKESGKIKTVIMQDPTSLDAMLERLKAGKRASEAVLGSTGEAKEEDKEEFPYGIELTKQDFKSNPLIGREKELRLLGAMLLDDEKSVIIHGKPGIGKTTLVEGLAYKIKNGESHPTLNKSRIFQMSAADIVQGTILRGKLEEKVNKIIDALMNIENSILFIDEFHMLVGCGATLEDTNDVSNMLKPFVGNGKIKLIGATTDAEYIKILSNGAFARRFNGIPLKELTNEEILNILYNLIAKMESSKKIGFSYPEEIKKEILELIISLTDKQYMALDQRYNPDFALTILRNAYNFANYDGKDTLDASSLIEGASILDTINQDGKKYFEENVLKLSRKI